MAGLAPDFFPFFSLGLRSDRGIKEEDLKEQVHAVGGEEGLADWRGLEEPRDGGDAGFD